MVGFCLIKKINWQLLLIALYNNYVILSRRGSSVRFIKRPSHFVVQNLVNFCDIFRIFRLIACLIEPLPVFDCFIYSIYF